MTRPHVPDEVLSAAHDRARARADHDWAEADRLRAEIEAAGWKVVDRGTDFALSPAVPPDVSDGARVRYGSSASVPSRLADPPVGVATVVLLATAYPEDLARTLDGLRAYAPVGTSIVIVADAPSGEQVAALDALDVLAATDGVTDAADADAPLPPAIEVVWTSEALGHAAAMNVGIRRAAGPVVVLLDTSVEPTGDLISPLVAALADPSVAVTGGWGITSQDLRHFEDAPAGDVDAIEGYCQAFRRADYAERGPLDERFRFYRNLDIWWSLVLRDAGEGAGEEAGEDATPRRAVRLDGLPAIRHDHRGWISLPEEERDRQSRRNFYRIIDRFGGRTDLLVGTPATG